MSAPLPVSVTDTASYFLGLATSATPVHEAAYNKTRRVLTPKKQLSLHTFRKAAPRVRTNAYVWRKEQNGSRGAIVHCGNS